MLEYASKVRQMNILAVWWVSLLALQVLEGDPDNSKALFRRGTARIHLNEPDKAREDLSRAQSLTPDSKEAYASPFKLIWHLYYMPNNITL